MVPKIAKRGASFKGAAAYYLHDKGASTSERVAWIETRNLATDNPEIAWKIMAATAKSQDRLKAEAGIKATGRKSSDVVMTYSLAWHPDEKPTLTREEMVMAADDSLVALGADRHQALLVCHNDEPHPHVHVMLNRVSPEDGRILLSSKEKLKLSKWAQGYEEARGKIWCEQRVANNHAREVKAEFTRAAKDKPRHILEIEDAAIRNANRAVRDSEALKASEREKDAALASHGREMEARHKAQWASLSEEHKTRKHAVEAEAAAATQQAKEAIIARDAVAWRTLGKRQHAELLLFRTREQRVTGKLQNAIEAITAIKALRGVDYGSGFMGAAFNFLTSQSARLKRLQKTHLRERREFRRRQKREIEGAAHQINEVRQTRLRTNLERFYTQRGQLKFFQAMDRAVLKAKWKQRNLDRKDNWAKFEAGVDMRKQVAAQFARPRSGPDRGR